VTFVSVGGRRSSPDGCSEKDARRYWSEKDRRWYANWLRVGASPEVAYALSRAWHETDLSEVLPAVHVPTLVVA
jgi:hypothetical protein